MIDEKGNAVRTSSKIDNKNEIMEFLITNFRKIPGFKIDEYNKKFNSNFLKEYKEVLKSLKSQKLIKISKGIIQLTQKGIDLENIVTQEFYNSMDI
jgi:coproporphyrinogen III oxidase-like Fe-S oxidoreductase